ncbi:FIVAR domain-containing protein [Staphylococcus aureus]|uniref:FIVAR domain-containing protein n=1 Tax=Staphylococcus aureus TaxID=1280 RepID=UPI00351DAC7A
MIRRTPNANVDPQQVAQALNNAMTQLKQGIAYKEQTKADGNFVNADPDKQNAYNQAVAKAEALIRGTPDVVVPNPTRSSECFCRSFWVW